MRYAVRNSRLFLAPVTSLVCAVGVCGCVIDDRGGARGAPAAPAASVPDAGGPARRESAAETLNRAELTQPPGEADRGTLPAAPAPPPAAQ